MTDQTTPAQNVLSIVHTAIAVSDLEHQLGYWQGVLGFRLEGTAEVGRIITIKFHRPWTFKSSEIVK